MISNTIQLALEEHLYASRNHEQEELIEALSSLLLDTGWSKEAVDHDIPLFVQLWHNHRDQAEGFAKKQGIPSEILDYAKVFTGCRIPFINR